MSTSEKWLFFKSLIKVLCLLFAPFEFNKAISIQEKTKSVSDWFQASCFRTAPDGIALKYAMFTVDKENFK